MERQERLRAEVAERLSEVLEEGGQEDTSTYGWSGPGAHDSSRRDRKNKKLFEEAVYQHAELLGKQKIPGLDGVSRDNVSLEDAVRKIAPFDDEFYRRAGEISAACTRGSTAQGMPGGHAAMRRQFDRVEQLAEPLRVDILKTLKRLRLHNIGFIPGYLPSVYLSRCMVRLSIGAMTEDSEKYQGSIEDATEGIRLFHFLNQGDDGLTQMPQIIAALVTRGKASEALGMLEQALTDFRGVCAAIRIVGLTRWERQPSIHEATLKALVVLSRIKIRDNVPRPHYTDDDREALEEELGLGDFSYDKYMCANCGATRSRSVKLLVCADCKKKWFCSKKAGARSCERVQCELY